METECGKVLGYAIGQSRRLEVQTWSQWKELPPHLLHSAAAACVTRGRRGGGSRQGYRQGLDTGCKTIPVRVVHFAGSPSRPVYRFRAPFAAPGRLLLHIRSAYSIRCAASAYQFVHTSVPNARGVFKQTWIEGFP